MNADAAAIGAGGTLGFQWTLDTGFFEDLDNPTRHKGRFLLSRTPNRVTFPIESERLLVKVLA